MKMPGFNAEASLHRSTKTYRISGHYRHEPSAADSYVNSVVPAVPSGCSGCLDYDFDEAGTEWCFLYCTASECVMELCAASKA